MDLEALPPEEPTPPPAPPVAWTPAPWDTFGSPATGPAGWAPAAATPPGDGERLGLSRTTKVLAIGIAAAVIGAGAWAAGSAIHGSGPSVRFTPASATGTGPAGGPAATTPGPHRGGFGGGGGKVAGVDTSNGDITVNVRVRQPASSTPGAAPVTPATPTTTSRTIKTTGSTLFIVTKTGTAADVATGDRIVARGTASGTNTLTATTVMVVAAGIGPNPPKPPAAAPNIAAPPVPKGPANPPFAFGTVTSVTTSGANTNVVVTSPRGTETVVITPTTTIVETVKGAIGDVQPGDTVLARGHRNPDGSVSAAVVQVIGAGVGGQGRPGFGYGGPGGVGPAFGRGGFGPRPWAGKGGAPGAPANNTTSSPV